MLNTRLIIAIIVVMVVLASANGFTQNLSTEQSEGPLSAGLTPALANAVEYRDLTFGQRMRLGANFLIDPDSVWDVDIGYKNEVTDANLVSFCERAQNGQGLIGVATEGVYMVPAQAQGIIALCNSAGGLTLVFIDPQKGEPVIAWNPNPISVEGTADQGSIHGR